MGIGETYDGLSLLSRPTYGMACAKTGENVWGIAMAPTCVDVPWAHEPRRSLQTFGVFHGEVTSSGLLLSV